MSCVICIVCCACPMCVDIRYHCRSPVTSLMHNQKFQRDCFRKKTVLGIDNSFRWRTTAEVVSEVLEVSYGANFSLLSDTASKAVNRRCMFTFSGARGRKGGRKSATRAETVGGSRKSGETWEERGSRRRGK